MSSSDDDVYPTTAFDASDAEDSGSEDYSSLLPKAATKKNRSGGFESMNLFPPVFRAIRGKGYRVRYLAFFYNRYLAFFYNRAVRCLTLRCRSQHLSSARPSPSLLPEETSWRWRAQAVAKPPHFSSQHSIT